MHRSSFFQCLYFPLVEDKNLYLICLFQLDLPKVRHTNIPIIANYFRILPKSEGFSNFPVEIYSSVHHETKHCQVFLSTSPQCQSNNICINNDMLKFSVVSFILAYTLLQMAFKSCFCMIIFISLSLSIKF